MSRFDRQQFLGEDNSKKNSGLTVGIAGLGGGGSHIVQQLAHIGIGGIVGVDPDIVEESNLNRLIGATWQDVKKKTPKIEVGRRVFYGLQPDARPSFHQKEWQLVGHSLRGCHVIFGCVDSYRERNELEQFARRFLIPYIDIGMDIFPFEGGHTVSGQVVLSMPGHPCLRCMGIITDTRLEEEARNYGNVGDRPQVVWPNAILASTAVGLFVQLVTPWHNDHVESAYIEYDGNAHTLSTSNRLKSLGDRTCQHYKSDEVGDPFFKLLKIDQT